MNALVPVWILNAGIPELHDVFAAVHRRLVQHETVPPPTASPTRTSRAHDSLHHAIGVHVIIHPQAWPATSDRFQDWSWGQLAPGLGESERVSRAVALHHLLSPPGITKDVGRPTPQRSHKARCTAAEACYALS
jgi:hypothetical protein